MALGPVGNMSRPSITETQRAEATPTRTPTPTSGPEQTTNTPDAQQLRPTQETQDATRAIQSGNETQIRQNLEEGWLEAGRRRTGPRGGKTTAQAPVRGLGGGNTDFA